MEKRGRKFAANQYNELFAFHFIEDKEQFSSLDVSTLDKLYFGHSHSVSVNPKIMEEPTSFQIRSERFDRYCQRLGSSEYFFPPMRDPIRQDLNPLLKLLSRDDLTFYGTYYMSISNNSKG